MNNSKITIDKLNNLIINIKNDHFNLESLFKNSKFKYLEEIINFYLLQLKKLNIKKININKTYELLEYFDYNFKIFDKEKRKINYSIMEEANIIADDLIYKTLNKNGRSISLPINIDYLIDYSISNYISKKNINKVLYYIIIKLAILYSIINV